jgi:hypothetical protein
VPKIEQELKMALGKVRSNETKKDERIRAINNNPCGICRAAGSPVCKGHRGGGGGSSTSNRHELDSSSDAPPIFSLTLEKLFGKSAVWRRPHSWDMIFEFANPDALLSIKLDMDNGLLVFSGHKELLADQQTVLDKFFEAIEREFNAFKQELTHRGISTENMQVNRVGNKLTITIPHPKYYDAFVQQLTDKNLLVTQMESLPSERLTTLCEKGSEQSDGVNESSTPTPFDINGPKPKGWPKK